MKRLSTEEFIAKARLVHGEMYDYSKVIYDFSNRKVIIGCTTHGDFLQNPNNHLNGQWCPRCRGNIKFTVSDFVKRARKVHGIFYDYSKTDYRSSHINVCITCPKHGDFYQAPTSHWNGFGCPKCACYRVSVPETEFLDFLNIPSVDRQVCICRKNVDGIDKLSNTIYEFLGDFWHGNPTKYNPAHINVFCKKSFGTLYAETLSKFSVLKSTNYHVKYVWESDWKIFKMGKIPFPNIQTF